MKIAEALKGVPRPMLTKLVAFLEKLPPGEVFTTTEFEAMNPPGSFGNLRRFQELVPHQHKLKGRTYWGCKKAIADLKAGRG